MMPGEYPKSLDPYMKYPTPMVRSPGQRYSKLRMGSKIVGTYFSLIEHIKENLRTRCTSRFHFIHYT